MGPPPKGDSEQRLSDKARRKELLVERSVKQYVERFLHEEEEALANTVEKVTQSTGEKVGALHESLTGRLVKLAEKLEDLEGYVRSCTLFDSDGVKPMAALGSPRGAAQGVGFAVSELN